MLQLHTIIYFLHTSLCIVWPADQSLLYVDLVRWQCLMIKTKLMKHSFSISYINSINFLCAHMHFLTTDDLGHNSAIELDLIITKSHLTKISLLYPIFVISISVKIIYCIIFNNLLYPCSSYWNSTKRLSSIMQVPLSFSTASTAFSRYDSCLCSSMKLHTTDNVCLR